MTINLRTQKETQINLRMEALWKHQVVLNGFTAKRVGNGKSSKTEMRMTFLYYPLLHHLVKLEVGDKASQVEEEEEEEGAEEAILIGLVTQMSHCFPHSPPSMTHKPVQAHQIAATTPECVA
jgi:hypothetical protein